MATIGGCRHGKGISQFAIVLLCLLCALLAADSLQSSATTDESLELEQQQQTHQLSSSQLSRRRNYQGDQGTEKKGQYPNTDRFRDQTKNADYRGRSSGGLNRPRMPYKRSGRGAGGAGNYGGAGNDGGFEDNPPDDDTKDGPTESANEPFGPDGRNPDAKREEQQDCEDCDSGDSPMDAPHSAQQMKQKHGVNLGPKVTEAAAKALQGRDKAWILAHPDDAKTLIADSIRETLGQDTHDAPSTAKKNAEKAVGAGVPDQSLADTLKQAANSATDPKAPGGKFDPLKALLKDAISDGIEHSADKPYERPLDGDSANDPEEDCDPSCTDRSKCKMCNKGDFLNEDIAACESSRVMRTCDPMQDSSTKLVVDVPNPEKGCKPDDSPSKRFKCGENSTRCVCMSPKGPTPNSCQCQYWPQSEPQSQ